MMKKILFAAALPLMLAACSKTPDAEKMAGKLVDQARELMMNKEYNAARDTIKSMREQYPTALVARGAAILLLDSVELLSAREELEPIGPALEAERATLQELMQDEHYKKNPAYYEQNRQVFAMEQLYDSIATKVKFFERKIAEDKKKQ